MMKYIKKVIIYGGTGALFLFLMGKCVTEMKDSADAARDKRLQENNITKSKLPDGCSLDYIGDYNFPTGGYAPIVIVRCKAMDTITTDSTSSNGKFRKPNTDIIIQDPSK